MFAHTTLWWRGSFLADMLGALPIWCCSGYFCFSDVGYMKMFLNVDCVLELPRPLCCQLTVFVASHCTVSVTGSLWTSLLTRAVYQRRCSHMGPQLEAIGCTHVQFLASMNKRFEYCTSDKL